MPTHHTHTHRVMGGHVLGNLGVRVRHIITHSISPYEQRAFAGFFSRDIPLFMRRMFGNAMIMFPGLGGAYAVYYLTEKKAKELAKKKKE